MTSTAQRTMLFAAFAQLANARHWNCTRREVERQRITTALFGQPRSWSDLTDSDIDRLKTRLIALRDETDIAAQVADQTSTEDGQRRRLLHRIRLDLGGAGFFESYAAQLSRSLFDRADWTALPIPQLTQLRDTIHNRARAHTRRSIAHPF